MKLLTLFAVAALSAAAFAFPAQAYCRGCVVDGDAKPVIVPVNARAEALPEPPVADCHTERQQRTINGRVRIKRVAICE